MSLDHQDHREEDPLPLQSNLLSPAELQQLEREIPLLQGGVVKAVNISLLFGGILALSYNPNLPDALRSLLEDGRPALVLSLFLSLQALTLLLYCWNQSDKRLSRHYSITSFPPYAQKPVTPVDI